MGWKHYVNSARMDLVGFTAAGLTPKDDPEGANLSSGSLLITDGKPPSFARIAECEAPRAFVFARQPD
jgi:hypothetical protein